MSQWLFPCLPNGQGLREMIIPRMKISTPMGESGLIFPTLRCGPEGNRKVPFFMEGGGEEISNYTRPRHPSNVRKRGS